MFLSPAAGGDHRKSGCCHESGRDKTDGRGAGICVDAVGMEVRRGFFKKVSNVLHFQRGSIAALEGVRMRLADFLSQREFRIRRFRIWFSTAETLNLLKRLKLFFNA